MSRICDGIVGVVVHQGIQSFNFINTINPKYSPIMSSRNQLSSLTPKIGSAAHRFSKELVTYSPNHALVIPIRLSKKFAGMKHVRPAATHHIPQTRCC